MDYKYIYSVLDEFDKDGLLIISGGAIGVDSTAVQWAINNGVQYFEFKPRWKDDRGVYNRNAAKERNTLIVKSAQLVLAFQENRSGGTQDSIDKACKFGIPVLVYHK